MGIGVGSEVPNLKAVTVLATGGERSIASRCFNLECEVSQRLRGTAGALLRDNSFWRSDIEA